MKTIYTLGFILVSLLVLSCVYVERCVERKIYIESDNPKVEAKKAYDMENDQCLEE